MPEGKSTVTLDFEYDGGDVGFDNQTPVALGIGYGPTQCRFTE
jgi:hypothetical protein